MEISKIVDKEGKELNILTKVTDLDIENGVVTIPEDIDVIGNKAFYKLQGLIKIKIPSNVKEIKSEAFALCDGLQELSFEDGLEKMGGSVFYECTGLKDVKLPNSLKSIGPEAFYGCTALKTIQLPELIEEIPDELFYRCSSLTSFEIPKSVKSIGYDVFEDCSELREITIPKGVIEIKNVIFCGCTQLKQIKVEEGNEVFKSVAGVLFSIDGKQLICYPTGRNCVRYEIPKDVEEICDYAFEGVSRLKEIRINDGVKTIGDGAFCGCRNLAKITIPSTVTSLGEEAFSECRSLERVNIQEGIQSIEWNTFYNCEKLKEIKIPNSVNSIGDNVFLACKELQKVDLPQSLIHMEFNAFNKNKFLGGESCFASYKNGTVYYGQAKGKKDLTFPVNFLAAFSSKREFDKFIEESDFRAFNSNFPDIQKMFHRREDIDTVCFFKFAKALGCFSKKHIINKNGEETEVTLSQKASSTLAQLVKIPPFDSDVYSRLFEELTVFSEPNQDFIEFISSNGYGNMRTLFVLEKDYPGIFAKAISNFSEVKNRRTTIGADGKNKVIPWEEALIKFYKGMVYTGVSKEDEDIAKVFAQKDLKQSVFDKAVKLRQSAIEENIPEHILGEELKEEKEQLEEDSHVEEESIKDSIKRIKRQTAKSMKQSIDILESIYKKRFYYEWLSKRDAHNPIIGLFCNCCATIENADYGKDISRATIVAPDVQNLIIRNLKDEIVAKAAVYVNSELGYAVINNFELNSGYRQTQVKDPLGGRYSGDDKEKEAKTPKERKEEENRELIFESFMKGIKDFIKRYNELHPDKPIKQVNTGTGYTKLKKQVERFERATQKLTVPANYSFYDAMRYDQYILYKEDNEIENER
jgi:hypothetical protein